MNALRSAGIEVDPKNAFRALQMMGGEGFEGNQELNALHDAMRRGSGDGKGNKGEGEGDDKQ